MALHKYKLLITDIDGTLINRAGDISPENREALARARAAGVTVCLSTGRAVTAASRYIRELELDGFHVFFDGALVSHTKTGERVFARHIQPSLVEEMVRFAAENGIDLELYTATEYFTGRDTWSTGIKSSFFGLQANIGDLHGIWEREEIIRAQIAVMNEENSRQAERFITLFSGRLDYTEASSPVQPEIAFINIIARGVSKGSALRSLTARLGLSPGEVVAVGDWINDLPLLEAAGFGIAMGNAHQSLKEIADHVTLDVEEDGLAEAIKRFIL